MKNCLLVLVLGMAVLCSAADVNLLDSKWNIYGKNTADQGTVIQKNGQIDCFSKIPKGMAGVSTAVIFKKPAVGNLVFGMDVKAENAVGTVYNNFCIYMDIAFADKTNEWGVLCPAANGTYDWKKISQTYKLPKPVTRINFYVLFRNMTGKASFRNIYLYNK